MSAINELALFCVKHPEIRAHKQIGGLINDAIAEYEKANKSLQIDGVTLAQQYHEINRMRAMFEGAWEIIGKTLEWLVNYTEANEDDSAHELYLDLRKWYEGVSAVQSSDKNTPI